MTAAVLAAALAAFAPAQPARAGALAELFDVSGGALSAVKAPAVTGAAASAQAPAAQAEAAAGAAYPPFIFTDEASLKEPVIKAVGSARATLDVALYNISLPEAARAIISARDRGVRVRVIIDQAHVFPKCGRDIQTLIDAGLDLRVLSGKGGGAMHNKYAIFDGKLLQTGSPNWTNTAETNNYENAVFTRDADMLQGYQADFEWMWGLAVAPNAQHQKPPKFTPPPAPGRPAVAFNGVLLPKYSFSPGGGTRGIILSALAAARKSIDVAMFSFTDRQLFDALAAAKARGVSVRLMVFRGQKFPFFRDAVSAGLDLRFSDGRGPNGMMHHKYAVLDGALAIAGAYNWTGTAEQHNCENTFYADNPAVAAGYAAQFEKLFARAWQPGQQPPAAQALPATE